MSALNRGEAQVVALAGIIQGVRLALDVARSGQADAHAYAASLASILHLSANGPEAVFGGLSGVRTGLRVLIAQLRGEQRDPELLRISATMMTLERKYTRNERLQTELRQRLETIADNHEPNQAGEPIVVRALADAYLATISTLTPRARVPGNPLILKEDVNIIRIRACLLATLRSVALWRQLGGRGWRLLLQRRQIADIAQRLLGRSLGSV